MAYCKNCGSQIDNYATVCPCCGMAQGGMAAADNGSFGWGLLGCCVPIVGLILFLVWKDTKPKSAKAAGIGALISVIGAVVIYILAFLIMGVAVGMSGY